jgi:hypothetical protein
MHVQYDLLGPQQNRCEITTSSRCEQHADDFAVHDQAGHAVKCQFSASVVASPHVGRDPRGGRRRTARGAAQGGRAVASDALRRGAW